MPHYRITKYYYHYYVYILFFFFTICAAISIFWSDFSPSSTSRNCRLDHFLFSLCFTPHLFSLPEKETGMGNS